MNDFFQQYQQQITRRQFFGRTSTGIGVAALAALLNRDLLGAEKNSTANEKRFGGLPSVPHFPATAKRVIFLFQSGGPSQLDLFDYKPNLQRQHGLEMPASIRAGQRLTTMTSDQQKKPIAAALRKFIRQGKCGAEISELLPHLGKVADDICIARSIHTDAINHDPAINLFFTGNQIPGSPSFGSWMSYGLGTENENLPTFAVFISGGEPGDAPLNGRQWGSAFLPSQNQGIKFRGNGDPVLYLSNPPGISSALRRKMLDGAAELNRLQYQAEGDPETNTRIQQFELAYRMQTAVPELTNLADEPAHTFELYGEEAKQPGTYAANCLLARRMIERGVRFVQLCHRGWDHHHSLPDLLPRKCKQTDQSSAALVQDLKQRGLLKDTLIVWAGEFGRTVFSQGDVAKPEYGRDHHPRCFSAWLAGGGIRQGATVGQTDEYSWNVTEDPIHVHDLQATILHCLGIDHERLIYSHQGRNFRLTDIAGNVAKKLLA